LGHFGPFLYCTKVDAKLDKLVPLSHKFAKQSRVGIFRNERTRSTPLDPKTHVLGHFGPFRHCTKVDAKLAELVPLSHKFDKRGRARIFRNERARSTPLDPKLRFWCVSDHFVTARKSMQNWPNWCHYRTSSLNKVTSEFFVRNAPDPLNLTQNSCFGAFQTVSVLYEVDAKLAEQVPLTQKFANGSCFDIFRKERT
jgi:hypothetical protein